MRSLVLTLALASLAANAQNVLSGRQPTRADGVLRADRLTDLQSAIDGDPWDGPTAVMLGPAGAVTWDLGRRRAALGGGDPGRQQRRLPGLGVGRRRELA